MHNFGVSNGTSTVGYDTDYIDYMTSTEANPFTFEPNTFPYVPEPKNGDEIMRFSSMVVFTLIFLIFE